MVTAFGCGPMQMDSLSGLRCGGDSATDSSVDIFVSSVADLSLSTIVGVQRAVSVSVSCGCGGGGVGGGGGSGGAMGSGSEATNCLRHFSLQKTISDEFSPGSV